MERPGTSTSGGEEGDLLEGMMGSCEYPLLILEGVEEFKPSREQQSFSQVLGAEIGIDARVWSKVLPTEMPRAM